MITTLTFLGTAEHILAERSEPMHYRDITQAALDAGILVTQGKTPEATLDWSAIQEALYLLSIPGMGESIREGLQTPLTECSADPGW